MTDFPAGHIATDPECTCGQDGANIVDFECAGVWTLKDGGYVPASNPRQAPISLAQIGHHRRAVLRDCERTEGAIRGSFLVGGEPVDTVRYPNRHRERNARVSPSAPPAP
jgi:hypothetical protein